MWFVREPGISLRVVPNEAIISLANEAIVSVFTESFGLFREKN